MTSVGGVSLSSYKPGEGPKRGVINAHRAGGLHVASQCRSRRAVRQHFKLQLDWGHPLFVFAYMWPVASSVSLLLKSSVSG